MIRRDLTLGALSGRPADRAFSSVEQARARVKSIAPCIFASTATDNIFCLRPDSEAVAEGIRRHI
jgi:hypothetical protein